MAIIQQNKFKLSVVILLLGLGLTVLQAQTMYIKEYNGTQATYNVNDILKLSFPDGNILVSKTGGITHIFPLTDVRYLNFYNITTGISFEKNLNSQSLLLLYPNPVRDLLNIQWTSTENQRVIIEIFSFEGKLIYKEAINSPTNFYQIQVSALPKGIYLCRLINGATIETKKILKL